MKTCSLLRSRSLALSLAALTLAAASPQAARAQTLSLASGDNVTVNSTGTHGTCQGATINNATTSYSGPSFTVSTSGTAAFTLGRAAPSTPPTSVAARL